LSPASLVIGGGRGGKVCQFVQLIERKGRRKGAYSLQFLKGRTDRYFFLGEEPVRGRAPSPTMKWKEKGKWRAEWCAEKGGLPVLGQGKGGKEKGGHPFLPRKGESAGGEVLCSAVGEGGTGGEKRLTILFFREEGEKGRREGAISVLESYGLLFEGQSQTRGQSLFDRSRREEKNKEKQQQRGEGKSTFPYPVN